MDTSIIKQNTNILDLISKDTLLKRVAGTGGGEWAGPCPMCGGKDRFRVQPYHPNGGRWYCRGCGEGRWHDVIDYNQARDHVDFKEALFQLAPTDFNAHRQEHREPRLQAESNEINLAQWMTTAHEFLDDCINNLWGDKGEGALKYLHERGLSDGTLKRWMIGYHPYDGYGDSQEWGISGPRKLWIPKGIVIPCQDEEGLHYLKIRQRVGKPKYHIIKGGRPWLFGAQTFIDKLIAFLFEGEFDVMLAWQTGYKLGYGSLPAGQKFKPEWGHFFDSLEDLIIAYDNDKEGQKASDRLCKLSPQFHKAMPFPFGNDLTDYFIKGGDVFEWIYQEVGWLG
jgi:DNA primase